jgi:hypothetical protein
MNIRNIITSMLILVLLALLGCGPEAKHDNPLDPVNGRGVWGTVRNSVASAVPGAVITARPVNINTTCDAQGAYSLDLPGGEKYVLSVSHPQYWDATDTIDVPADGKLEKDFIITGKPALSQPKVSTYKIAHENGTFDRGLKIECRGTHPDGQSYLGDYLFYAVVNNSNYPAIINPLDSYNNIYIWDLNLGLIFGTISDPETLIIGKPVTFIIEPGEGLASLQSTVPQFEPVPTNLIPNGGTLILPGSLSWTNAQASGVDITVEIWQGTQLRWSLNTANVSSVECPNTLESGENYAWLVRTTDINGNTAATEATFTLP